jgi:NADPH:quinone reductase-like Zn-dependent oxidoreductase
MRAYAIDEFGKPGSVRDLPTPEPLEGQVLINVKAAGLNAFDVAVINGSAKEYLEHRFPLIPGNDVSGVVEALGPGVQGIEVGSEVFGSQGKQFQGGGTIAEYVTAVAGTIAPKPPTLEHTEASTIATAGLTALNLIDRIGAKQNNLLLVLGATGGVGSFLVPLATARGARVIAVTRAEYADYARTLGATDVIDYTAHHPADQLRSLAASGIDALVDLVGDADLVTSLADQVTAEGWAVSCAGGVNDTLLEKFGLQGGQVHGGGLDRLSQLAQQLQSLPKPSIRTYPLDQAADAIAEQATRHVRGKLVIVPD